MAKIEQHEAEALVVSAKTLESYIGIKERRVRQLAEEGVMVKSGRGRYILHQCVRNYLALIQSNKEIKEDNSDDKINYDDEHALHERAKREKAELELQVMKGILHEADMVEKVMTDMLTFFRSRILTIPSKLAPSLTVEKDAKVIQRILKDEVRNALEELKDYDPILFYSDKKIEIVDEGEIDEWESSDTQEDSEAVQ